MKNIAVLKYTIMFDPSETWSNGYLFENDFAKFFSDKGFEAQIIVSAGGTGERIINIVRKDIVVQPKPVQEGQPIQQQVKKVQQATPTKAFKSYEQTGVPKSLVNQDKRPPKVQFGIPGRTNRQKLRGSF